MLLAQSEAGFAALMRLTTANNEADADAELLRDIGVPVPEVTLAAAE